MITLYQFEISPFCDKIRRVLNWKKQPYEVHEVTLWQALTQVKRLNPVGKLPCIEHDGRFVADSSDIALYLEERFPTPPLLPADPVQRAHCHVLEDWADESLYFYEMRLRFGEPHNAKRWLPVLSAHDSAWFRALAPRILPRVFSRQLGQQGLGRKPTPAVVADVERHVKALAVLLDQGDFLVGSSLSIADIAVFVQLFCIRGSDEGAAALEKEPIVLRWMGRVDDLTAR
jgi:glutathione S-transferase